MREQAPSKDLSSERLSELIATLRQWWNDATADNNWSHDDCTVADDTIAALRQLQSTHEPATGPVAPIACIRVGDDDTCEVVHLYAPGLPPGEHDLFPVPLNPNGQLAPSMFSEALCPHGMRLAENICGPCSQGRPNRAAQPPRPKRLEARTVLVRPDTLAVTHIHDGEEIVTGDDDGQAWVATFSSRIAAENFVEMAGLQAKAIYAQRNTSTKGEGQ